MEIPTRINPEDSDGGRGEELQGGKTKNVVVHFGLSFHTTVHPSSLSLSHLLSPFALVFALPHACS